LQQQHAFKATTDSSNWETGMILLPRNNTTTASHKTNHNKTTPEFYTRVLQITTTKENLVTTDSSLSLSLTLTHTHKNSNKKKHKSIK
jgi:hypothetical protein